jgi:hypothetical protein
VCPAFSFCCSVCVCVRVCARARARSLTLCVLAAIIQSLGPPALLRPMMYYEIGEFCVSRRAKHLPCDAHTNSSS